MIVIAYLHFFPVEMNLNLNEGGNESLTVVKVTVVQESKQFCCEYLAKLSNNLYQS